MVIEMKKFLKLICLIVSLLLILAGCQHSSSAGDDKKIVIWTAGNDDTNEYYLRECQKKFPDYDIVVEYMNTSSIAAKVVEEGEDCSCDIIVQEEYAYLQKCEPYLMELENIDFSVFLDELVPESHKYVPEEKSSGCVIVAPKILEEHGLAVPTCYQDLLDPKYKGLISMPSPLSSSTGYMFLRQLTNTWGEDKAFEYFEKFSENVLQYTSSGSGALTMLEQGETAIALGMVSQSVTEINKGAELKILFFDEGAPYGLYGGAVLKNSADRECVMEVFDFIVTDLFKGNNEQFFPDQIFKDFVPRIEGYPDNIPFGDMSNDTLEEKERLQAKWNFN